jgi:transposase-like protein
MDSKLCSIWEQRLAEHENSGKSIVAWCKEQGVKENQFYYWRKRLRTGRAETTQPIQWLSLDLQISKQAGPVGRDCMTVHIGQAAIEIRKGFDHHLLREIVQVLQTI